ATEFLERYRDCYTDVGLTETEGVRRLPNYCDFTIGEYIKTMPAWTAGNIAALGKTIKWTYRQWDTVQQKNTREYLEALVAKPRTEKKIFQYNQQFKTISDKLIKEQKFDLHTQRILYLKNFSPYVKQQLFYQHNISLGNKEKESQPTKFEIILDKATIIINIDEKLKEFENSREKQEKISEIIERFDCFPQTSKI